LCFDFCPVIFACNCGIHNIGAQNHRKPAAAAADKPTHSELDFFQNSSSSNAAAPAKPSVQESEAVPVKKRKQPVEAVVEPVAETKKQKKKKAKAEAQSIEDDESSFVILLPFHSDLFDFSIFNQNNQSLFSRRRFVLPTSHQRKVAS
jgi:hypothetical protein